jgi:hypothetical protein
MGRRYVHSRKKYNMIYKRKGGMKSLMFALLSCRDSFLEVPTCGRSVLTRVLLSISRESFAFPVHLVSGYNESQSKEE